MSKEDVHSIMRACGIIPLERKLKKQDEEGKKEPTSDCKEIEHSPCDDQG